MARSRDDTAKKLKEFIRQAQDELEDLQEKGEGVLDDARDRKESLEEFVKDNPLLSLGVAFVGGYFLGRLFKRVRR
ncbi:hypothetical protein GF367_02665 [Candidatus Woesearchaeota archaeon]|nr:hypothetical protein [Candidatus Woesearchaeota archaeon]